MALVPSHRLITSFFGHFATFISCVFSHRRGLLVNMTMADLRRPRQSPHPPNKSTWSMFITRRPGHYGKAQTFLNAEEFNWLEQWLKIRAALHPKNDLVFSARSNSVHRGLDTNLKKAWVDIRTSVATHIKNSKTMEERNRMSHFMCHSIAIADQFYVCPLDIHQAWGNKGHFEWSMVGELQWKGKETRCKLKLITCEICLVLIILIA